MKKNTALFFSLVGLSASLVPVVASGCKTPQVTEAKHAEKSCGCAKKDNACGCKQGDCSCEGCAEHAKR